MKQPWLKWFPGDWAADKGLRLCSLAARGLWHELCLIAHDCEPYGHVRPGGEPPSAQEIATLVGAEADEVGRLLAELERRKVFSRTADGAIYSRRMVRDREWSLKCSEWGAKGGTPKPTPRPTPQPTPRPSRARVQNQNQNQSQKSESEIRAREEEDPTGGAASPAAPLPRKPATGDHAEAIQHWEAEWARTRLGTAYTIQTKDGVAFAKLLKLKGSSLNEVKARSTRLLESGDSFYLKAAEPSLLLSKWSQLAIDVPEKQVEPKGFQAIRDRRRGRGAELEPLQRAFALLDRPKGKGGAT